jgi:hypothetical protein
VLIRFTLAVASILAAGALVACGGDDDGDEATATVTRPAPSSTREPDSTATPEPEQTATPGGGATGLDAIVEAARANDGAALEALVRYEQVPCTTTVEGIGGPPECEPGEADGTPVDVVFATNCEGYFARRGALNFDEIAFGVFGSGDPLFGVYTIDPASQLARIEEWADAEYAIVMNRIGPADQVFAYAIISDGEQIIGTAAGCGESPEEWVDFQGLGEPIEVP